MSTKALRVGRDRRRSASVGVKMKLGLIPLKPGVPVARAGSSAEVGERRDRPARRSRSEAACPDLWPGAQAGFVTPVGGGPGMIDLAGPVGRCVEEQAA